MNLGQFLGLLYRIDNVVAALVVFAPPIAAHYAGVTGGPLLFCIVCSVVAGCLAHQWVRQVLAGNPVPAPLRNTALILGLLVPGLLMLFALASSAIPAAAPASGGGGSGMPAMLTARQAGVSVETILAAKAKEMRDNAYVTTPAGASVPLSLIPGQEASYDTIRWNPTIDGPKIVVVGLPLVGKADWIKVECDEADGITAAGEVAQDRAIACPHPYEKAKLTTQDNFPVVIAPLEDREFVARLELKMKRQPQGIHLVAEKLAPNTPATFSEDLVKTVIDGNDIRSDWRVVVVAVKDAPAPSTKHNPLELNKFGWELRVGWHDGDHKTEKLHFDKSTTGLDAVELWVGHTYPHPVDVHVFLFPI